MKTYHILIGNCEELLSGFIETLFREACAGQAKVQCTRTGRVGDFIRQASEGDFDLVIQVPHNLFPEVSAPTPIGLIGESIRAIRAIKERRPAPIIAILAVEERTRYEPLLLEAGADCVLELPFGGEELREAVGRILRLPAREERVTGKPWFFAGVLMRGFRRLRQA
jgi:DNA-binding response OmpR family regulator